MTLTKVVAEHRPKIDDRRYAAFKGFVRGQLEQVDAHFQTGKGGFWVNDDEEEFMIALGFLNRAHTVVDELRDEDREELFRWERILKDELTEAQYKSAVHRGQFIDCVQ